ncbi:hypothetical protein BGW38_005828 [Lunasporangiospora selenospora]|uniref:Zn(2)-C6 fungal-type domain-containing protein n=1 Tax=Lunasporangiospora selenospora TaxID=979761 RepID=A0A9P6KGE1_9FUNG|nr:hypothetical protein BGW38_005828 [Lunasporangiospora selenospora]
MDESQLTAMEASVRQKRLKAGTACTNCRRKKLRCTGTPNCARCISHNLDCVVDEVLFLKTNSLQSLYEKTGTSHSPLPAQQLQQNSLPHRPSKNSPQHAYHQHDTSSFSSGSCSADEMTGDDYFDHRHSVDYQSDRRMSASSMTSASSQSPSPSSPFDYSGSSYSFSQNFFHSNASPESSHSFSTSAPATLAQRRTDPESVPTLRSRKLSAKKSSQQRTSRDHGSTKQKQKRGDNSQEGDSPSTQSEKPSVAQSTQVPPSMSEGKKSTGLKSVVSTMSLDGHGQHFHGSSSGFYVCQLSSRYRKGLYPLPMAHLNDSDLWSHSLQMTSERELPSKDDMETLLGLFFRYMYPFAPMFIRKTFMEQHRTTRPDLSQILILNAIFCNACWYSDDPVVKQDSTKYFNRAKIILDETYHVSRISTIQALLLMSHHQYAMGNYSGGWLYTGMATRIATDIGLHRQDIQVDEPEQSEIRKRVWWALYMSDRVGGGILGRPLTLRDKDHNVQMPDYDWIQHVVGEDEVEYPFEPERIISCRLLWSVKLFQQMGSVLDAMHCIEAETNGTFLAEISRTQLPQLHNSLTSWFLSLPNELMYTPYTMSPNSNHPPSPPTALMHMFYYTCLTMLHRPYLRPVNSSAIDPNFLISSRNICTAAATNVCHIADSLMLHGQLRDTCYYGMACLLAAGTVHVHNAIAPTPSNRETTRAGLSKTVKAAHELVKTFPVAESLIAVALDVFASQTSSVPTEMAASFIDISTFVAPFMDITQLQSASIGNIYEAARLAKMAKDGPGPAPSIQLRHPYGNFSMPLPESTKGQSATKLSALWQSQISTAVAMAAIAFGGSDPQQEQQQFFASPLDVPEALRLAPIDSMLFQVDSAITTSGPTAGSLAGLGAFGSTPTAPIVTDPLLNLGSLHAAPNPGFNMVQQTQMNPTPQPSAPSFEPMLQQQSSTPHVVTSQSTSNSQYSTVQSQNLMQEISSNLSTLLQMRLASSQPWDVNVSQQQDVSHHQQQQQPGSALHAASQQQSARMEDDTADPPSPPAISSDDMDMESSSLSDDASQSSVTSSLPSNPRVGSDESLSMPRQDAQTQCNFLSSEEEHSTDPVDAHLKEVVLASEPRVSPHPYEDFLASLTKADERHAKESGKVGMGMGMGLVDLRRVGERPMEN